MGFCKLCTFRVDKCAPVRYNVSMLKRRYMMMTACSTTKSGYCGYTAAACTFARNEKILDTALGVVSIVISLEIPVLCT